MIQSRAFSSCRRIAEAADEMRGGGCMTGNYACRYERDGREPASGVFLSLFGGKGHPGVERESNGITDTEHDKGRYPVIAQGSRARAPVRCGDFMCHWCSYRFWRGLRIWRLIIGFRLNGLLLTAGAAAYVAMTLRFSVMRHASLAGTLVRQSLGIQAILLLIDALTGLRGWSVDYAIPCVALFEVAAVLLMMLVNRMNWQSYFMYQITITFLSFVPLIFWKIGWTHHPLLTVLAAGVSVAALAATVILGDRSVKRELKRRFHV